MASRGLLRRRSKRRGLGRPWRVELLSYPGFQRSYLVFIDGSGPSPSSADGPPQAATSADDLHARQPLRRCGPGPLLPEVSLSQCCKPFSCQGHLFCPAVGRISLPHDELLSLKYLQHLRQLHGMYATEA